MKSYIETKIEACGREYAIQVLDRTSNPFQVGMIVGPNDEFEAIGKPVDYRSTAIRQCADLAIKWLRK